MLDENIETAMIVEDDVDWDIHVRDVFTELSHNLAQQTLFPSLSPRSNQTIAPYGKGIVRRRFVTCHVVLANLFPTKGLDWDILYVGSAWDIPNEENRPPHLLYHDPFAPTRDQTGGSYVNELEGWGAKVTNTSRHRLVAPSWYPVSTIGYAVTKKGAQKLLYNLGYKGFGSPIDLAMIDLIKKGVVDSYTIIPPIVTRFRTGGAKDSDIDEVKPEDAEAEPGSENLNMSARKAMERLSNKTS